MKQALKKTFRDLKGESIIRRGLERETLRIDGKGRLSQKKHPFKLGSSLTNRYITTDYSEALLELVTPPFATVEELYRWSKELHQFCYHSIGEELLWPYSMPCILEGEENIPIAEYGDSNVGKMKRLYRVGLSNRYGSAMQVIAGIHYNFSMSDHFWERYFEHTEATISLQDFKSQKYMGLVRNFLRIGWIIPYLFGASPAACKSFYHGEIDKHPFLKQKDGKLIYGENSTSLRMSDLGYRNYEQDSLNIQYNDLGDYVRGLVTAIETPAKRWALIGVKSGDEYLQLNDSILQIENEYYGMIRPKRAAFSGEPPSVALIERGIQYVEIRSVDINPHDPNGLSMEQMQLLDLILIHCLQGSEAEISVEEDREIKENFNRVVLRGRDPSLELYHHGKKILIGDLVAKICGELLRLRGDFDLSDATIQLVEEYRLGKKELLSAKVFNEFQESCFCGSGMRLARLHKEECNVKPLLFNEFQAESERSHQLKRELEESVGLNFEDYLGQYYHSAAQCLLDGA